MNLPAERQSQEANLALRLRARDPLALADLYDACGALVCRLILRYVRDAATAEDLTQETFLYVWTRIGAFDAARGTLRQWVCLVARSRAKDYLRSTTFRMVSHSASMDEAENYPAESPAGRMERLDCSRLLREPWMRLTSQQRETLRLAHWSGLSQPEIAARLDRPLGTVKTWMRKGQRSLRAALEGAHVC